MNKLVKDGEPEGVDAIPPRRHGNGWRVLVQPKRRTIDPGAWQWLYDHEPDASLLSWLFGNFFSDATNTSGLLAVSLVISVILLYFTDREVSERLLDAVFIIVGFYFGGAVAKKPEQSN